MKGENEMMMKIHNDMASVQGEIDRAQSEYNRIKNDPRHAKRAKELDLKLQKLRKAQFRQWNQK